MIKFMYSILFIFGSQILLSLAEEPIKSEENRQELLLCRKCGTDVADSYYLFSHQSPGARKSERRKLFGKNNITVQTLVNPFGVQFEIVTAEKARCNNIGHPQGADSWFPGYSWRICTCPHCGAHLGWTFENSSLATAEKSAPTKTFHGLILSNILGENSYQVMQNLKILQLQYELHKFPNNYAEYLQSAMNEQYCTRDSEYSKFSNNLNVVPTMLHSLFHNLLLLRMNTQ